MKNPTVCPFFKESRVDAGSVIAAQSSTPSRLTWNLMEMADWQYDEGVDSWGKTTLDILTDQLGNMDVD
jgi:hypothetical protein